MIAFYIANGEIGTEEQMACYSLNFLMHVKDDAL